MIRSLRLTVLVACLAAPLAAQVGNANSSGKAALRQTIDGVVKPFLARHQVPGAIVAVTLKGRRHFFPYGNATDDGAPLPRAALDCVNGLSYRLQPAGSAHAAFRPQAGTTSPPDYSRANRSHTFTLKVSAGDREEA